MTKEFSWAGDVTWSLGMCSRWRKSQAVAISLLEESGVAGKRRRCFGEQQ